MGLLPISFLAGVLTVLAPCILPMLPIIIGGALTDGKKSILRPLMVTLSLGLSIVVFTLLLKASTALITIPDIFWQLFSATIIFIFALTLLFPRGWAYIQPFFSLSNGIKNKANQQIATSAQDSSLGGAFLIGIALGPVFAACSPTYFLILGTVLPSSYGIGLLNLFAYALGLAVVLLAIALAGQKVMSRLNIAADPNGWFKRGMGILFLLVAIAIITGLDKRVETFLIEKGYGVTNIEKELLESFDESQEVDTKDSIEVSGHTLPIPDSEILSGGPPKDGIPPIDVPKFIPIIEATFLNPSDEGIGIVTESGESKFYPFRILVWHEIVNDSIDYSGDAIFPISVTYCPLCMTGIVFEGMVEGEPVTFGTSGKLWQSNLLMYDRQAMESDESLWSQVLGTAINGPSVGTKLKIYPSVITTFSQWREAHPDSLVLSRDTGSQRDYTQDPYAGYYDSHEVLFPTDFNDTVTHPKERVLGLEVEGNYIAFKKESLTSREEVFAGHFIQVKRTGDSIEFFIDNNEEAHPFVEGFWFSWQAVHPATVLR
jgi:cytochrome c biogenesis protein CcdA